MGVDFVNAYVDHKFDGSHRLQYDFDANKHVFKDVKGFGSADGKSKVLTSAYDTFEDVMADAAGRKIIVDSDIECNSTFTGASYNGTTIEGAGGTITVAHNGALFSAVEDMVFEGVWFIGANNPAYVNNCLIAGACHRLAMTLCDAYQFYNVFNIAYFPENMKIIINSFREALDYIAWGAGNYCTWMGNQFRESKNGMYAQGYFPSIIGNSINNMHGGLVKSGTGIFVGNCYENKPGIIKGNTIYYCGEAIYCGQRGNAAIIANQIADCYYGIKCIADTSQVAALEILNNVFVTGTFISCIEFLSHADGYDDLTIEGNKMRQQAVATNGIKFAVSENGLRSFKNNDFEKATNPIILYSAAQERAIKAYDNNIGTITYTA